MEVPGSGSQWSPGGGGFVGSGSYYHHQEGLGWRSMSPGARASILAAFVLVGGPLAIMRGGLMGVSAARTLVFLMLATSSGGGGPGEVLTSAAPPSITYRGGPTWPQGLGRPIISAHGGGRSGAKPRKRCPPGFHWNGRRCVSN